MSATTQDPACPEHGEPMRYELQQDWWRGKCGCPIRVFEENRRAYVPASSAAFNPPQRLHHLTTWHPLEAA